MKVSAIAAIGMRGQIGLRTGEIPWDCPQDLENFRVATAGCAMLAGHVTYDLVSKAIPEHKLLQTKRTLFRWSNREEHPMDVLSRIERLGHEHVWIIGGAFTYKAFYQYLNWEIRVNVVTYDNDPIEDKDHVFFPLSEYAIQLPAT